MSNKADDEFIDDPRTARSLYKSYFQVKRLIAPRMNENYSEVKDYNPFKRKRNQVSMPRYYSNSRKNARLGNNLPVNNVQLMGQAMYRARQRSFRKGRSFRKNMPYRRSRRYKRRRLNKKKRSTTINFRQWMNIIAPVKRIISSSYHVLPGSGLNKITYLGNTNAIPTDVTPDQKAFITHGSFARWKAVMKAAFNTTTVANFDNENQNVWLYSGTTYRITNPSNSGLTVTFYELYPKQWTAPMIEKGPLAELNTLMGDNGVFPPDAADISTDIGNYNNLVNSTATFPWDKLELSPVMNISLFPQTFWAKFKCFRKKKKILGPGQVFTYKQSSKYGKIIGDNFDGTTHCKPRFLIIKLSAPHHSNVAASASGKDLVCCNLQVDTFDIVRQLPATTNIQTVQLNDKALGANVSCLPDGSLAGPGQVPNPVGNAVVPLGR